MLKVGDTVVVIRESRLDESAANCSRFGVGDMFIIREIHIDSSREKWYRPRKGFSTGVHENLVRPTDQVTKTENLIQIIC